MPPIVSILGLLVVLAILFDFLMTTISIRSSGPIAKYASAAVARLLDLAPEDGLVAQYQGPVILILVACLWIAGLWFGWSLVFVGGQAELLDRNEVPGSLEDIISFTGSTISTMGLGVLTPKAAGWHAVTVLSSITGMVVLTLSVTYVLNVTQVATQSRAFCRQLDKLTEAVRRLSRHDGAALLLSMDDTLNDSASFLRQSRTCFPLATYYDRRGTRDDVERGARDLTVAMPEDAPTLGPSERARLAILRENLQELVA